MLPLAQARMPLGRGQTSQFLEKKEQALKHPAQQMPKLQSFSEEK
jgi:hypothetical protein